jgi:hypothetical protein
VAMCKHLPAARPDKLKILRNLGKSACKNKVR